MCVAPLLGQASLLHMFHFKTTVKTNSIRDFQNLYTYISIIINHHTIAYIEAKPILQFIFALQLKFWYVIYLIQENGGKVSCQNVRPIFFSLSDNIYVGGEVI